MTDLSLSFSQPRSLSLFYLSPVQLRGLTEQLRKAPDIQAGSTHHSHLLVPTFPTPRGLISVGLFAYKYPSQLLTDVRRNKCKKKKISRSLHIGGFQPNFSYLETLNHLQNLILVRPSASRLPQKPVELESSQHL